MNDYKILVAPTVFGLEDKVREYLQIADGWKPNGAPFVTANGWYQAMVKEPTYVIENAPPPPPPGPPQEDVPFKKG